MLIHLLILNYNGRRLLAECLPSILEAAAASRHRCDVAVVDNASSDDSAAWLSQAWPEVRLIRQPNRGLCSFNEVVAGLEGRVAVLLNNDIKLAADCLDPLVAPLDAAGADDCFMSVPRCLRFDGRTYEGFKTAVRWRWGLVQATSLFAGHERGILRPGRTASAGAAIAVDCRKFVLLGGFDPLYLPGRLEDLDLAFRAHQAGYHARYVPQALVYHLGMGTFGPAFGIEGCQRLALRNTLLFQWKNLRSPRHVGRQLLSLPLRLAWDLCRAAWMPARRRWPTARAMLAALRRLREVRPAPGGPRSVGREREFFRCFHPAAIFQQ